MVRETSMICYKELVELGKINERCQQVYSYISKHPSETDTEIARGLGFDDPNKVRPRRKDLYDMGLVVECELRKCSVTNKLCHTWESQVYVPRKNFFDKKEELRGLHKYREFKHRHLAGIIILVHIWLNKYSAKKYRAMIDYADFNRSKGVYVVRCIREDV